MSLVPIYVNVCLYVLLIRLGRKICKLNVLVFYSFYTEQESNI